MNQRRRFGWLAGLMLLSGSPPLFACSCAEPPPPREALERADAVFLGEVERLTLVGGVPGKLARVAATFAVQRSWKGVVEPRVVVETLVDTGVCGYPFAQDKTYLVYASFLGDNVLHTNLCSRTAEAAAVHTDVTALGPGTPITASQ